MGRICATLLLSLTVYVSACDSDDKSSGDGEVAPAPQIAQLPMGTLNVGQVPSLPEPLPLPAEPPVLVAAVSQPLPIDASAPNAVIPVEAPAPIAAVTQPLPVEAPAPIAAVTQPLPVEAPVPIAEIPVEAPAPVAVVSQPLLIETSAPIAVLPVEVPAPTATVTQPLPVEVPAPIAAVSQALPVEAPAPIPAEPIASVTDPAPNHQGASPEPLLDRQMLAIFGDSISTGALANTHLGGSLKGPLQLQLTGLFSGDITTATEAQRALSNPDLAAVTASADYGLQSSISRLTGAQQIEMVNLASFGAISDDMTYMLQGLNSAEGTLGLKAQWIFVMLGSNDFCSEKTPEDFKISYENGLAHIRNSHPDAHFILVPIPSIHQLASIEHTYIPAIPGLTTGLSCRTLHKRACNRLREGDAAQRVSDMNAVIISAYDQLQEQLGSEKVSLVRSLLDKQIQPDELAIDCFHPSAKGQENLGRLIGDAMRR